MCCCLAPILAGAEIFDSWMCLTVGCRLYFLDKQNHARPLVVGLSNVNKPRLSLLFFLLASFCTGGGSGDVSSILIYSSHGVWKRVCWAQFFFLARVSSLPSACSKVAQKWQKSEF